MTRQYRKRFYDDQDQPANGENVHKGDPGDPDETIAVANTLILEAARPEPVWREIDEPARSGADFLVRFADPDMDTRLARWRVGRFFTGRRWEHGGRWVAADTLMPLPTQPTEYFATEPTADDVPDHDALSGLRAQMAEEDEQPGLS